MLFEVTHKFFTRKKVHLPLLKKKKKKKKKKIKKKNKKNFKKKIKI